MSGQLLAHTTGTVSPAQDEPSLQARSFFSGRTWHWLALGIVTLVAAGMDLFRLETQQSNPYYTAAIKSMLMSWHNFFFVSFDPGGFISIDKPPVSLWIQATFAAMFGVSSFSVLLPEALAGVGSVVLLYFLVRRTFGTTAGFVAALVLALMPISVAVNRNNTPDTILVFSLLLATWALYSALETGRLRWLLVCAVLVGVGFNTKMLEAYIVVPAFGLTYFLAVSFPWRKRLLHLALALLVMLVISFSWAVAVDLTPASQRPYVGSSNSNSVVDLALGYNGILRIFGIQSIGREMSTAGTQEQSSQGGEMSGGGEMPGASDEAGATGPFRLINSSLGSQVGWLVVLGVVGLGVAIARTGMRPPLDRKQRAYVLWGTWFLVAGIVFSFSSTIHGYYVMLLGPSVGALVGIGLQALWNEYQHADWRGWLLPATLLLTALIQFSILGAYSTFSSLLSPLVIGLCLLSCIVLVLARLKIWPVSRSSTGRSAVALALCSLLIAPTAWAALTVLGGENPLIPSAGPGIMRGGTMMRAGGSMPGGSPSRGAMPGGSMQGGGAGLDVATKTYLLEHQGSTRFLVAASNALSLSSLILETGKPVMAYGGFSGTDPVLTTEHLVSLIDTNQIRYFLVAHISSSMSGSMPMMGGGGDAVTSWVQNHCSVVSIPGADQGNQGAASSQQGQSQFPAGMTIKQNVYDCAQHH